MENKKKNTSNKNNNKLIEILSSLRCKGEVVEVHTVSHMCLRIGCRRKTGREEGRERERQ